MFEKKVMYTYLIFILILLQLSFAAPILTTNDEFINVQRGTTQTITQPGDNTGFTKFATQFAKNLPTLEYTLVENEFIPATHTQLSEAVRFITFEIQDVSAIESIKIEFRIERQNSFSLNPATTALYGYTAEEKWELIPSSVAFTTQNHYYFKSETQYYQAFAIAKKITQVIQPAVEEPQENLEENNQVDEFDPLLEFDEGTTPTNPAETATSPSNSAQPIVREYIDDSEKPNYLLIIIVIIVILLIIGGTVTYVLGKRIAQPSNVHSVDDQTLELKVRELINKQKSNGQIVNELLDQGYSLQSVMDELKKLGRM